MQEILRPKQAAEQLGVSVPTIYRLCLAGELRKIKIGARASGIIGIREFVARRLEAAK